jgi:hypothetical protein
MRGLKATLVIVLATLFGLAICFQASAQLGARRGDRSNFVSGQVVAVGSNSITIKTKDGTTQVISITDKTTYVRNRQPASLSDFKVDDYVFAHGARDVSGQFIADRIVGGDAPLRGGKARSNGIFGEVVSVDAAAGTITVRERDGTTQVIYTTANTVFTRNRQPAKIADFKVGDRVFAHGARDASGQFVADRIFGRDFKPHAHRSTSIFGQVVSVEPAAATMTIVDSDGKRQVVQVKALLSRNGQSATLADFQAGDHVDIVGVRGADGQLVATRVIGSSVRSGSN